MLSASYADDTVDWHENTGLGLSATRSIAAGAGGAAAVHAADLDGDGDADVLYAAYLDDAIYWHENLGSGAFAERRAVTVAADGAWDVHSADLDGDGDADVLSASLFEDTVGWHENLGGGRFAMRRAISTRTLGAVSVHAVDLDGDGDADVLSASLFEDTVGWHENLGGGRFAMRRAISTRTLGGFRCMRWTWTGTATGRAVGIAVRGHGRLAREPGRRGVLRASADLHGDVERGLGARGGPEWRRHCRGVVGPGVEWRDCMARTPGSRNSGQRDIGGRPESATGSDWEFAVTRPPPLAMPADAAGQDPVRTNGTTGSAAASLQFSDARLLADDISGGRSVYPADLDGDGDLDVLAASFRTPRSVGSKTRATGRSRRDT